jgi:hypothetical protein
MAAKKVKVSRYMPWRRLGGEEVQHLLILNLGTRWGQHHAPAALPPVPIGQEAGWALELVCMQRLEEKSSAPVGDQTLVVQSVVKHYTDWATLAPAVIPFMKQNRSINSTSLSEVVFLEKQF